MRTVVVIWNQKMMLFLPDGDDFVAESSNGNMSDELVPRKHVTLLKTVWKVFVYKIIPLFNKAAFCCHDDSTFMYTKTNLRV